jgi:hypothetical protein
VPAATAAVALLLLFLLPLPLLLLLPLLPLLLHCRCCYCALLLLLQTPVHQALPEASPSPAAATECLIRLQVCCLQGKAVIPRQQCQPAAPHTPTPTLLQPRLLQTAGPAGLP